MEFSCTLCNRRYGSKPALEQHQRDSPAHKNTFHCEACDSYLTSKKDLKTHRRNFQLYKSCSKPPPKPAEPVQETREFFQFPALHKDVARAVLPGVSFTWYNEDADDIPRREYLTNVMGKFKCHNTACKKKSWGSKKVPIEIRGYARNGYSVLVYNQRCKRCRCLGNFILDENSYVERIAYRIKKWAGVRVIPGGPREKTGKPHEMEFCEGCKRGKCSWESYM